MKSHIPDGVYRGFRRADLNLKRAKFRVIGEFEANDGSTYEYGPTRVFFLCWRQGKVINQGFIDRYEANGVMEAVLFSCLWGNMNGRITITEDYLDRCTFYDNDEEMRQDMDDANRNRFEYVA